MLNPLQQGLKRKPSMELAFIELVVEMLNPLQQGLKLNIAFNRQQIEDPGRNAQSITTRIETYGKIIDVPDIPVEMLNPLQQGLKHAIAYVPCERHVVEMLNPLQQGLKHVQFHWIILLTRVEMLNPLQQGLKHGAIARRV